MKNPATRIRRWLGENILTAAVALAIGFVGLSLWVHNLGSTFPFAPVASAAVAIIAAGWSVHSARLARQPQTNVAITLTLTPMHLSVKAALKGTTPSLLDSAAFVVNGVARTDVPDKPGENPRSVQGILGRYTGVWPLRLRNYGDSHGFDIPLLFFATAFPIEHLHRNLNLAVVLKASTGEEFISNTINVFPPPPSSS